jgi:hypothetical protein
MQQSLAVLDHFDDVAPGRVALGAQLGISLTRGGSGHRPHHHHHERVPRCRADIGVERQDHEMMMVIT